MLINIKEALNERNSLCKFISVKLSGSPAEVCIDSHHAEESMVIDFVGASFLSVTHIVVQTPFSAEMKSIGKLSDENVRLLKLYLPYAVLPYFSIKNKKCYAIAHFAQTLDGKIASSSGDSKWIGNDENLVHAHKMRAICNGILVGARTIEIDNPRLDVRLVTGKNPTKIIVGGDKLVIEDYTALDQNTIIFSQNHRDQPGECRVISLNKDQDEYKPKELLNTLYQIGIQSVYIEGGARTTSLFIKRHAIDQMQVHITPKIMGSGLTGFQFEGLSNVQDAITFRSYRYIPVGDHIMFIGELNEN